MKKLTLALSLGIAIISISGNALARAWTASPGVPIQSIATYDGNPSDLATYPFAVGIVFSSIPTNTCSPGNGTWFVDGTRSDIKSILAQATSAKLAGRKVQVLWDGCDTSGNPKIIGIWVQ